MEEDSTDDSGEELGTDPAVDRTSSGHVVDISKWTFGELKLDPRTSSGHVVDISKWTFGELKLDPIPKFVASTGFHPDLNIPDDEDEYFFTNSL